MTLRKVSKNQAMSPNDEAVFKLLYLACGLGSNSLTQNL